MATGKSTSVWWRSYCSAGFKYENHNYQRLQELISLVNEYSDIFGSKTLAVEQVVDFWVDVNMISALKNKFSHLVPFGVGIEPPTFGMVVYPDERKILGNGKSHVKVGYGDVEILFFNKSEDEVNAILDCDAMRVAVEIDFAKNFYSKNTSVISRYWECL